MSLALESEQPFRESSKQHPTAQPRQVGFGIGEETVVPDAGELSSIDVEPPSDEERMLLLWLFEESHYPQPAAFPFLPVADHLLTR